MDLTPLGPISSETDTIVGAWDTEHKVLYRIHRADGRIVYVQIMSTELRPPHMRQHSPDVMEEMRNLPLWHSEWDTLEISTLDIDVSYKLNSWKPHAVPEKDLLPFYPVVDRSRLPIIKKLFLRTTEVEYDNIRCVMKVADFPFQMPPIAHEISMYHAMGGSTLAPNLLAYVCESHNPDRIIGFLVDKLEGRRAGPEDLDECARSLRYMHTMMFHGDLNLRNIIITARGPKFISFKYAQLATNKNWKAREEERRRLAPVLGIRHQSPTMY